MLLNSQRLRVLHLISSTSGGAGRAAHRIHKSLSYLRPLLESKMLVMSKDIVDDTVQVMQLDWRRQLLTKLLAKAEAIKISKFHTLNPNYHTTGYPGAGLVSFLNTFPADILHIHGVDDNMLSIEDLSRLRKPLIWTMHDEWGYSGAEHYADPVDLMQPIPATSRYELGYTASSRNRAERGMDLNRSTWKRKWHAWKKPFQIVCPSKWLADNAARSKLMHGWKISVIPNPIDTVKWSPFDMNTARRLLGLPAHKTLILFGVDHGSAHPRKGADLLLHAFSLLKDREWISIGPPVLVVFGQQLAQHAENSDSPYLYIGKLRDEISLRILYAAVDAVAVPSRQDNLPNVAIEAHACGKPVVAFDVGGLSDIIEDGVTGALANPYDPHSLAQAINWVIRDPQRCFELGQAARLKAEKTWAESIVASQYHSIYDSVLSASTKSLMALA